MSDPASTVPGVTPLTAEQAELLAFVKAAPTRQADLEVAVWARYRINLTAYTQRVLALLDEPAAMEAEPALVGRLRRLRQARRLARSRASA